MATLFQEKDISIQRGQQGESTEKYYECCVYVCPDETTGFYAYVANLPGVVSEGETKEEAIEGIKDAFRGAVAVYRESNESIPWTHDLEPIPDGAVEKRIIVNA
jgi:predicted RNase H-like HicB family nuclease